MSNSSLATFKSISPNKTSPRNHEIDTITIHCFVGQVTVERMKKTFDNPEKKAAPNYGIGTDGTIALFVSEQDRSWCSSNAANDHRAITIECASDSKPPYAINDKVYKSLINLLVDVCERNRIPALLWKGNKDLIGKVDQQNMTVHRWFANKSCPGDYIYDRLGQIADEVNQRLKANLQKVPFMVEVGVGSLNIRLGPGTSYPKVGCYIPKGTYTIEAVQNGWGRLKNGAGWISLAYVYKIS